MAKAPCLWSRGRARERRVITERIRNLLESNPELVNENILGLTFTDKSAGEMKYRVVEGAIGERAEAYGLARFIHSAWKRSCARQVRIFNRSTNSITGYSCDGIWEKLGLECISGGWRTLPNSCGIS